MKVTRYTAVWCGPCKRIGPAVENLCAINGVDSEVIDIDESPELAAAAGIQAVPTFIVTNLLGEEVWRGSGSAAVAHLAAVIAK